MKKKSPYRRKATAEEKAWLESMRDPVALRQWRVDHGLPPDFPARVDDPREGTTLGRQFGRASKGYKRQENRGKANKRR
jgi:hypothetical protein